MTDADLLCGVKEIAKHLGRTPKQAEHLIKKKLIPTFKLGGSVCSTRSSLSEHFTLLLGKLGENGEYLGTK
jgi:hypothetical protein